MNSSSSHRSTVKIPTNPFTPICGCKNQQNIGNQCFCLKIDFRTTMRAIEKRMTLCGSAKLGINWKSISHSIRGLEWEKIEWKWEGSDRFQAATVWVPQRTLSIGFAVFVRKYIHKAIPGDPGAWMANNSGILNSFQRSNMPTNAHKAALPAPRVRI